jgi:hypothetical protein
MVMKTMKVVGLVVVEEEIAQNALCSVPPLKSLILCHTITWVLYILNILQCQGESA